MITALVLIVTHAVAAVAGAYAWVHVFPTDAKTAATKAVSDAQKLVAAGVAATQKLADVKKIVTPTGTTGPTGA
jgi:hypothetical protein